MSILSQKNFRMRHDFCSSLLIFWFLKNLAPLPHLNPVSAPVSDTTVLKIYIRNFRIGNTDLIAKILTRKKKLER